MGVSVLLLLEELFYMLDSVIVIRMVKSLTFSSKAVMIVGTRIKSLSLELS
jgi:hypothetical protein